jgi:hypothetical protein
MEAGKVENKEAGAITMPTMHARVHANGAPGHMILREDTRCHVVVVQREPEDFLSASWEHVCAEA